MAIFFLLTTASVFLSTSINVFSPIDVSWGYFLVDVDQKISSTNIIQKCLFDVYWKIAQLPINWKNLVYVSQKIVLIDVVLKNLVDDDKKRLWQKTLADTGKKIVSADVDWKNPNRH